MQIRRRLRLPAIPSACTLRAGPARALALLGALAVAACGGGGNDESGARSGVTVAQPLTASPLAVAPAEKVTLQAQCTGNGAITYRWDAGDGRALEDSHVASHAFSYPAEGDYRPKVTCVDERGGLSVSATDAPLRVAVPSHTLVSIQAQAGASTANTTQVDFNAECQGPPGVPLFISWDFGDGATGVPPALPASTASVSHTYDNTRSTQYTATAHCQAMSRIKTPRGESLDAPQTVTGSTTVSVAPAGARPTITSPLRVEPIIPTTAAPATFTLACDPGNGGTVRYTFDFGDGTPVERNNTTGRAVHAYVSDGRKAATQHLARATCTTSNPLTGERSQEQTLRLNVRSPVLSLFAGAADRPRAIQRMARAADGTIYVSQTADHRILKALPGGSIVPFAGTGQPGRADGVEPAFNQPTGLALGPGGVLYVADTGNHAIRAVSPQGKVSTVAGGRGAGSANGADASFSAPTGIAVDSRGIVYVADTQNHLIRRIATDGTVSTLAGTGSADWVDGPALSASFNRPVGLAVDLDGSVYVSEEGNHTVRRIAPDGQVSTLAGTGSPCETDPVSLKRRLTVVQTGQACLNRPVGLALDRRDGTLVFADSDSHRIRKVQLSSRTVSLVAGNGVPGPLDGDLARTSFASPTDVAVAPDTGVVTILDMGNNSIREWDGMEANTFVHQGSGRVDAESGAQARFFNPQGLASDAAGNVYVADYDNHAIRKVTPEGKVTTLAGGGSVRDKGGAVDGPAASARFKYPIAVAADPAGNVYVADRWNHAIRRIAPDGTVSTVAGGKDAQGIPMKGFRDGPGADALFNEPTGVALDAQGNLFVADSQNHLIRKIDATGRVTTFAGIFGQTVSSGVDLATATFDTLRNLAFDGAGNLFVSQAGPQSIRKIAPGGAVSTLASNIDEPLGMAADTSGNLYVAAYNEGGILKFSPTGSLTRLSVPSSMEIRTGGSFPFGITLVGRRLIFSSGEHLATIDFAP